jgi:hypothetical protein
MLSRMRLIAVARPKSNVVIYLEPNVDLHPESNIVLNNVTDELVHYSSLVRQNIHEYVPLILEPMIQHVIPP